jgi:4-carboxymuconolactone decarboxylase
MRELYFIFVTVIGFLQIPMQSINAQSMKKEEVPQNISAFPLGKENTGFKQYFTGESWLAPLTGNKDLNVPMSNVTFEPGFRNNWHSHTGGQILIAVGGVGYYQERGKAARRLLPGDVVEIAPDIEHWHDSWFSHLAIGCNPQTNKNIWLERVDDRQYAEATKGNGGTGLSATDPELDAIFGNFTKEVQQYGNLDTKTRLMITLASNIASQAQTEYRMMLESALNAGITPIEIKEILYQAVAYAGMAKVMDFVGITNEVLLAHGVRLPLEGQAVVSAETRFDKGLALQKSIFGERIDQMHKNAPENQKHIQRYLSANCFGDYQTRGGLDVKTRELLTFSILVSLGGCESQVKGHIQGNVNVGNSKDTLLAVVTQLLPYIGYPRTLNAIACLNEVIPKDK